VTALTVKVFPRKMSFKSLRTFALPSFVLNAWMYFSSGYRNSPDLFLPVLTLIMLEKVYPLFPNK
jgi:hypothetical protein